MPKEPCGITTYRTSSNRTSVHKSYFGAAPSPYFLGAILQKHVKKFEEEYPETPKALLEDTYVDGIQSGRDSVEELQKFTDEAKTIMAKGGFKLHKWHSNVKGNGGRET